MPCGRGSSLLGRAVTGSPGTTRAEQRFEGVAKIPAEKPWAGGIPGEGECARHARTRAAGPRGRCERLWKAGVVSRWPGTLGGAPHWLTASRSGRSSGSSRAPIPSDLGSLESLWKLCWLWGRGGGSGGGRAPFRDHNGLGQKAATWVERSNLILNRFRR